MLPGSPFSLSASGIGRLDEDVLDDVAEHVGQPKITTGISVSQPLVVQSEQVQDRGVQVVEVDLVADGFDPVGVG